VNVTEVPAHIDVVEAVMLIDGFTAVLTLIVIALLVAV